MDSIFKLFTRCMASAVMATPFCLFSSIDVQQAERPLQDVKFNFEKPAAEFKKDFDTKAERALRVQHKKTATSQNHRFFSMIANAVGAVFGVLATIGACILVPQFWGPLIFIFSVAPLLACLLGVGLLSAFITAPCLAYTCGSAYYQELNNGPVFEPTFVSKS